MVKNIHPEVKILHDLFLRAKKAYRINELWYDHSCAIGISYREGTALYKVTFVYTPSGCWNYWYHTRVIGLDKLIHTDFNTDQIFRAFENSRLLSRT